MKKASEGCKTRAESRRNGMESMIFERCNQHMLSKMEEVSFGRTT